MRRHVHGSFAVGLVLVIALLASTAGLGYAQHGGGWHGGGGGWRGGWWGPGWGYPYYGYPYPYAYPYPSGYPADSPPVMAESSPQTYIEQEAPAQQYWYYCQNPQGYYPYVRECPGGWQQVAPQPPPPPR
jgi:hypothetical protein